MKQKQREVHNLQEPRSINILPPVTLLHRRCRKDPEKVNAVRLELKENVSGGKEALREGRATAGGRLLTKKVGESRNFGGIRKTWNRRMLESLPQGSRRCCKRKAIAKVNEKFFATGLRVLPRPGKN